MELSGDQWVEDINQPGNNARDPYRFISFSLREKLIKMVLEDGLSVYKACKRIRVNYSTGKSIVKQYKIKGSIFKRKFQKKPIEQPPSNYQYHSTSRDQASNQQDLNEIGPQAKVSETSTIACPEAPLQFYPNMPLYYPMFYPYHPYNYPLIANYHLQTATNHFV